jgi:hypothetical protein
VSGLLSAGQVALYAMQAGLSPQAATTATAIALAESGGNPVAEGDQGTSYGLWQVHYTVHPQFDPNRLFDPSYNAHAMAQLSGGGSDWSPWTTYNTGAYQTYLQTAASAVTAASGTQVSADGSESRIRSSGGGGGDSSSSGGAQKGVQWQVGPFDLSPVLWGGMVLLGAGLMLGGVAMLALMVVKGAAPAAKAAAETAALPRRLARRATGRPAARRRSAPTPPPRRGPARAQRPAGKETSPRYTTAQQRKAAQRAQQERFTNAMVGLRRRQRAQEADTTPLSEIPF